MDSEKRICVGCGKEFSAFINSSQKYHSGHCANLNKKKKIKISQLQEEINNEVFEEVNKLKHRTINNFNDYLNVSSDKKEIELILKLPDFNINFVIDKNEKPKDNKTKPEKIVFNFLEELGFEHNKDFIFQHKILNYFVDFYFPKIKLGLEVDGDYWHCNPIKYKATDIVKFPTGKFTAKEIWNKDKIREKRILNEIKLTRIWETDIINESYKKDLLIICSDL